MFLVQAYPRVTLEMWCDAHERAFEFFGGACRTGIYNHMKPAVRRLVAISAGMFKPELWQLCGHYGIKPAACMPGEDWERGTSERQLRHSRRNLFLPRPEAASYPELNAWLAKRCVREAKRQVHPNIETRTIWQVFKDERPRLAALGRRFNGCREFEVKASTGCLVPFDHNHYSVHASAAGRKVTIRAYADRISVLLDGEEVAEHPRFFRRGKIIYDPWHYVPMLPGNPARSRMALRSRTGNRPALWAGCTASSPAAWTETGNSSRSCRRFPGSGLKRSKPRAPVHSIMVPAPLKEWLGSWTALKPNRIAGKLSEARVANSPPMVPVAPFRRVPASADIVRRGKPYPLGTAGRNGSFFRA